MSVGACATHMVREKTNGVRCHRQAHRVVTPDVVGSSPTAPVFFTNHVGPKVINAYSLVKEQKNVVSDLY